MPGPHCPTNGRHRHPFYYTRDESIMLETLRNDAKINGANLVRIVEDIHPYRYVRGKVTAQFFAVDDPGQYEPKIKKCEFYLMNYSSARDPADTNALVYIIRPNQYNTPVYKRIALNPWLLFPCPYFLFLNPDRYVINCKGVTQGPIGVKKFVYRYLPADTCTISSNYGDSAITLTLMPGKTYYVKMKPVIFRFLARPAAQFELLTQSAGTRCLRKSRLSRHWEDFQLPEYPDPLH
jgi:hypothetical protein